MTSFPWVSSSVLALGIPTFLPRERHLAISEPSALRRLAGRVLIHQLSRALRKMDESPREEAARDALHGRRRLDAIGALTFAFATAVAIADRTILYVGVGSTDISSIAMRRCSAMKALRSSSRVTRSISLSKCTVAVSCKMPARKGPHRVVHAGAVDKYDGGLVGLDLSGVGVAVSCLAVNLNAHQRLPPAALPAARRPCFRSAIRSLGSSRPIDRRIVPSPMPPAASASASMRWWVVLAG